MFVCEISPAEWGVRPIGNCSQYFIRLNKSLVVIFTPECEECVKCKSVWPNRGLEPAPLSLLCCKSQGRSQRKVLGCPSTPLSHSLSTPPLAKRHFHWRMGSETYLILTELEGCTVNYGQCFPRRFMAQTPSARAINRKGKTRVRNLQYEPRKQR